CGRIEKFHKRKRAAEGNKCVANDDVLAAGARKPHGAPIVIDSAVAGAHKEESRLRRPLRSRNHTAEKLPLRIVAAAAKSPHAGYPVAAVRWHGSRNRRILPDLALRSF